MESGDEKDFKAEIKEQMAQTSMTLKNLNKTKIFDVFLKKIHTPVPESAIKSDLTHEKAVR